MRRYVDATAGADDCGSGPPDVRKRGVHTLDIADSAQRHREAAAHHEAAAATHAQSAEFWEQKGDPARAQLHREGAAYEQQGAALERRWAELIDAEPSDPNRV